MPTRYVLLDRDGVINYDSDDFVKSPQEWQAIEGSLEAIALLNRHGFEVAVISNQSGIARGLFDIATLEAIHEKMRQQLSQHGGWLKAIYYCPHAPNSSCTCRKPKPGMLLQFAKDYQINLADVVFLGDSLRDIEAAIAAGAQPILVTTGKGQQTLQANPHLTIPVFENLYDAAQYLVSQ